tara:strand:- start:170 stop:1423 length:1254 start_codon:yes stop_codon:yes gene_type:complete
LKDYKELANLKHIKQVESRFTNKKLAAFISPAGGGGSHFVLHKMQGHPHLMALVEDAFAIKAPEGGVTTAEFKQYFTSNFFPGRLLRQQLEPRKNDVEINNVKWLIMNKPELGRIAYHRNFHYNDISLIYCFRNPISFYYSWLEGWKSYGSGKYGITPDEKMIQHWFERTIMSSLYEFAQFYDPDKDHIVNLEQFSSNIDGSLESLFNFLKVPALKNDDLATVNTCRNEIAREIQGLDNTNSNKFSRDKITANFDKGTLKLSYNLDRSTTKPGTHEILFSSFVGSWQLPPRVQSDDIDMGVECDTLYAKTCNNHPLTKKMHTIQADRKNRTEEVLYCEKCETPHLGPGHYNYIRKEDSSFFNNWKNKEDSKQIYKRFSEKIDPGIMNYFAEELYLSDKDGTEFTKRMKNCLTRLYNF